MSDILYKNNLPLKIVHNFPKPEGATIEECKKQITEKLEYLKARGFGGVVTNYRFSDDYLQNEDDWQLFQFSLEEIKRMGMRAWIYDEHGYPSGNARGLTLASNPDYECRAIAKISEALDAGEEKTVSLPKGHKRFLYAASYVCNENGIPTQLDPVDEIICEEEQASVTFTNKTDKKLVICAFAEKHLYEGTHAQHNVCESRRYLDVTNHDAVREFIHNTYEQYTARVSNHYNAPLADGLIEAFFTDEPSLMGCYINGGLYPPRTLHQYDDSIPLYPIVNFGRDVENKFESLSGLNFRKNLIHLFYGNSAYTKNVRYYFHLTTSKLFEESYYAQIGNYCAQNNTRFSGHVLLEDDIRHHVIFEGNLFSLIRHMHIPGIDMLQSLPENVRRDMFTPKLISSIAHAYRRPHVMSEVSAHAQGGKVTADQMYASVALQYAYGVDIFTSYYSENMFEAESYAKYNRAIGKIGDTMAGLHKADVLLYYPIETFMMNHRSPDDKNSFGNFTAEENACKNGLYDLMYELCDAQVDFDFADLDVLKRLEIKKGKLIGGEGEVYKYLVLPPMEMTAEMNGVFSSLAQKGVKICIMRDSCFPDLNSASFGTIFSTASALVTSFDRHEESFVVDLDSPHPGVVCLCRDVNGTNRYLFVNSTSEPINVNCVLRDTGNAKVYSPYEDAVKEAKYTPDKSGTRFEFTLGTYEVLLVTE
ncbi:MAG: hypothetical protein IJY39_11895 [Clostridia bacterium]|nr:hypothetical protein [Clostridia bacterium]